MKKSLTVILQAIVIMVGVVVLALMLIEPHFEGRNVNATFYQIYFNDPFLAYAYTASLTFFFALYQAFVFLGYAGRNALRSEPALKALRTIKHCALVTIAFLLGAEAYFFVVVRGTDDIAGGVMLSLLMTLVASITAAVVSVVERRLRTP